MAQVPVIEKTEKLETGGGIQPFGQSARAGAAATNIASQVGSELAINSAVKRAELTGIELGKTPQGDVFPAFTATDKAFETAYRNQAKSTLGLEAQELMNRSLATVNQANRLTPQAVQEFEASMTKGLADITNNAPSADRQQMADTFAAQLQKTSTSLQSKLIAQGQEESLQRLNASQAQMATNTFDSGAAGDKELATDSHERSVSSWNDAADTGQISRTEADTRIRESLINYKLSLTFGDSQEAERKGKFDEFVANLGANPDKDLSFNENIGIVADVIKLNNATRSASAELRANTLSQGKRMAKSGALSTEYLANAKKTLLKSEYQDLVNTASVEATKRTKKQNDAMFARNNWSDPVTMAGVKAEDINATFNSMAMELFDEKLGTDSEMSLAQAKASIASETDFTIPGYVKEIGNLAASRKPALLNEASAAIQTMSVANPRAFASLNSKARSNVELYDQLIQQGESELDAANLATDAIYNVSDGEKTARKEALAIYAKATYLPKATRTPQQNLNTRIKWAKGVAGIKGDVPQAAEFANMMVGLFELHQSITGNEQAALDAAKKQFRVSYGESKQNSRKKDEVLLHPLEKELDMKEGSWPVVDALIQEQLDFQFADYNSIPVENREYTYATELATPTTTGEYEAAIARTSEINNQIRKQSGEGLLPRAELSAMKEELAELKKTKKNYKNPERLKITRTDAQGNVEKFDANFFADSSPTSVSGNRIYRTKIVGKSGIPEDMPGVLSVGNQGPIFSSDKKAYMSALAKQVALDGGDARYFAKQISESMTQAQEAQESSDLRKTQKIAFLESIKDETPSERIKRTTETAIAPVSQFGNFLIDKASNILPEEVKKGLRTLAGPLIDLLPEGKDMGDIQVSETAPQNLVTVQDERLNEGRPTNVPSVWNAEEYTDTGSIEKALESGDTFKSYDSKAAAETAADKTNSDEGIGSIEDIQDLPPADAGIASAISNAASIVGESLEDLTVIAQIESSLNPNAKAKTSSASGLFQFTNNAWRDAVRRFGKSQGVKESDKGNPQKEAVMAAELTKANRAELKKSLGREPTLSDVYLAHFAGVSGAKRALKAFDKNPNAPVSAGFSASAIKANKSLLKGTLSDVMARLDKKVSKAKGATSQ